MITKIEFQDNNLIKFISLINSHKLFKLKNFYVIETKPYPIVVECGKYITEFFIHKTVMEKIIKVAEKMGYNTVTEDCDDKKYLSFIKRIENRRYIDSSFRIHKDYYSFATVSNKHHPKTPKEFLKEMVLWRFFDENKFDKSDLE